jgi:hypothetical protein
MPVLFDGLISLHAQRRPGNPARPGSTQSMLCAETAFLTVGRRPECHSCADDDRKLLVLQILSPCRASVSSACLAASFIAFPGICYSLVTPDESRTRHPERLNRFILSDAISKVAAIALKRLFCMVPPVSLAGQAGPERSNP